jgi:hypothetical protein
LAKKSEFVNAVYQAALEAGLTDAAARVTAAQAAVESGYGKHAPGNNAFGIKAGKSWDGPTQTLMTNEVKGGKTTRLPQAFRAYDTPAAGMADRVSFMDRAFPGFSKAGSVGEAYDALANGRFGSYATTPRSDYESALNYVNTRYLGGHPVPPLPIGPLGSGRDITGPSTSEVPLPFSGPLIPPKAFAKMPTAASFGQDRLVPGQVTSPPEDFATNTGAPDLRTLGMAAPPVLPRGLSFASGAIVPPPVPMPGRPAALSAAPPAPAQRPSAPTAQPVPQQVRLQSGKMATPGVYPSSDGHHTFTVNPDGSITHNLNPGEIRGVIDPLREVNAPTIAGAMIRKMLPTALGNDATAFVPTIQSAAANAANNLGSAFSGFGSNVLGGIGGLFGQHPPALPRPFNLMGGVLPRQAPPLPTNRPNTLSVPQQSPWHQTRQQANQDLRDSGMLDQFGMIR